MRLSIVQGVVKRRLLVNFRVDPELIRQRLPAPFRPRLQRDAAVAGICLVRIEQLRPRLVPIALGVSVEHAAHRIAVCWDGPHGRLHEGVHFYRKDTNSLLNTLAGGRAFPGEHRRARFSIEDDGHEVRVEMRAQRDEAYLIVRGRATARLPEHSIFGSIEEATSFFERGSLEGSPGREAFHPDGIELHSESWAVHPFEIAEVRSSVFDDEAAFPRGSIRFDHALVMRDVQQVRTPVPDLCGEQIAG